MKSFICTNKAWYAKFIVKKRAEQEILIEIESEEGEGFTGEFAIRWNELGRALCPRIEAFDDAWGALFKEVPELCDAFAKNNSKNLNEEQTIDILKELGYVDQTPYELP